MSGGKQRFTVTCLFYYLAAIPYFLFLYMRKNKNWKEFTCSRSQGSNDTWVFNYLKLLLNTTVSEGMA